MAFRSENISIYTKKSNLFLLTLRSMRWTRPTGNWSPALVDRDFFPALAFAAFPFPDIF